MRSFMSETDLFLLLGVAAVFCNEMPATVVGHDSPGPAGFCWR